jgi:hypothetical protein
MKTLFNTTLFRRLSTVVLGCLFAVSLTVGCARKPIGVAQRTAIIEAPFAKTWAAVQAEMGAFSTNVVSDPVSGAVHFTERSMYQDEAEKYGHRPGSGASEFTVARMAATATVTPKSPNQTEVAVNCRLFRIRSVNDNRWHAWHSNGRFEEELLARVAARAQN